jgi:hypothetical protein
MGEIERDFQWKGHMIKDSKARRANFDKIKKDFLANLVANL